MHPISCINTYHDVTDLVKNMRWLQIQKLEYLENKI